MIALHDKIKKFHLSLSKFLLRPLLNFQCSYFQILTAFIEFLRDIRFASMSFLSS